MSFWYIYMEIYYLPLSLFLSSLSQHWYFCKILYSLLFNILQLIYCSFVPLYFAFLRFIRRPQAVAQSVYVCEMYRHFVERTKEHSCPQRKLQRHTTLNVSIITYFAGTPRRHGICTKLWIIVDTSKQSVCVCQTFSKTNLLSEKKCQVLV